MTTVSQCLRKLANSQLERTVPVSVFFPPRGSYALAVVKVSNGARGFDRLAGSGLSALGPVANGLGGHERRSAVRTQSGHSFFPPPCSSHAMSSAFEVRACRPNRPDNVAELEWGTGEAGRQHDSTGHIEMMEKERSACGVGDVTIAGVQKTDANHVKHPSGERKTPRPKQEEKMHELPAMSQGGFLQEVTVGSYNIHYSHLPLPDDDDDFLPGLHVDAADANLVILLPYAMMSKETEEKRKDVGVIVAVMLEVEVSDLGTHNLDYDSGLFYECKKDLLEESEMENSISELLDVKIPAVQIDEVPPSEDLSHADGSMQKSISSGCLNSVEWVPRSTMRPEFLDFKELDFEAAFGLKRSYSEGDLRNLGTKNTRIGSTTAVCSSFEQLLTISDLKTELRQLKLSRYREKKSKRNFGKKIKQVTQKGVFAVCLQEGSCRQSAKSSWKVCKDRRVQACRCKHQSRQAVEVGSGRRVLKSFLCKNKCPISNE
ncbi:hypothetical protein GW17_00000807 [Ensete ventricosum]|nr:hypothetical protein GW17_00000807 [Ensete ventricosum]